MTARIDCTLIIEDAFIRIPFVSGRSMADVTVNGRLQLSPGREGLNVKWATIRLPTDLYDKLIDFIESDAKEHIEGIMQNKENDDDEPNRP